MLTTCPECDLQISDKALTCPHCGYPLVSGAAPRQPRKKTHLRLPNGFGQISKLSDPNLRNPYRVMVPVGKTEEGRVIAKLLKPKSYFKTYNEAYEALLEYNRSPFDLDSQIRMKELYELWSKEYFKKIASASIRTITSAWSYCTPIYDEYVSVIRPRHIKQCMEQTDSPNTKARIKSMFNLMLDYAVEHDYAETNAAREYKLDKGIRKDIDAGRKEHLSFTEEEISILWKVSNQFPIVEILLIQIYMGWRPQELGLIKVENVDLEKWEVKGGMKTTAGTDRMVPIHENIKEICKRRYERAVSFKSEYWLTSEHGEFMTYDKYEKWFTKILAILNINPEHRPHDGRKTFITLCKNNNVDEYAIKKMCGHKIDDITERIYTDRKPEWLSEEISKIPTRENFQK